MKKMITVLMMTILYIQIFAQFNTSKKLLFEKKTFPLSAVKNVELSTSGGAIYEEGTTNGEAILEVYISKNGSAISMEDAKQDIPKYFDYETGLNGNTLFAKAKHKSFIWNKKNNISISYKVIVPTKVNSSISTSGGSLEAHNLNGNERLNTSGGNITADNIVGKLDASTSGGSITLSKSAGTLSISTSGGSLRMSNLKGIINSSTSGGSINAEKISGSLHTNTSGGSIFLKDLSCTTEASTSGGSITATFLDPGKGISLNTSGGSINVKAPKNKGYDLNLKGDRVNVSNMSFQGTMKKNKVLGKTNGGGIPFTASTSGGTVNVDMY